MTTCQQCGDEKIGDELLCAGCREADPVEPEEGDITTGDHLKFYQYGKRYLHVDEDEDWRKRLKVLMEQDGYFPNVWFISDYGNAHLLDLEER